MIDSGELQKRVSGYRKQCIDRQKQPSYNGLAVAIGVSAPTISHIVIGEYRNGKPYTPKPHSTRCVDNSDFDLIRALFDDRHI